MYIATSNAHEIVSAIEKLTEMHGGTVTVKSEVNKGSTFTVSLPLKIIQ